MFSRLHIINSRKYLLLFAVFIISLSLRFWILDKRWINPDEGAHLMDAVLVLDGMIPSIDFHSRQPLYVYANAAILKLFGTHYVSGRILPLMCSILVGWLVFLMAHMLFDEKVGLLSATLYWLLPLEVINSPLVKTEPLVILLTCVSMCALVSFSQNNRPGWLVVSGIFAAMGFYVRQSALIIPITVLGFLVLFYGRQIREIVRNFGYFLVGYTVVLVFAVLYFGRFMRMDEFLMSGLNPLGFLVPQGKKLLSITGLSIENANGSSSHVGSLHYDKYPLYLKYVGQVFRLHSFLIIGLAFSLLIFCRHILTRSTDQAKEHIMSHAILYLWLFSLLLAYVYFYYAQGFYIDYFREFLPPLVIIFSAWLRNFLPFFDREGVLEWFIIIGLCISAIFFFAESSLQWGLGAGSYACLSIAILALLYFVKAYESSARQIVFMFVLSFVIVIILAFQLAPLNPFFSGIVPKLTVAGIIVVIPWVLLEKRSVRYKDYIRFATLCVFLGAFFVSLTYSANLLGLRYDSVWSPHSLEKTSAYLRMHTRETAQVLSGAVIWELQALRRPYLNISHPLSFETTMSEREKKILETAIITEPPEVIILDGYTEKTYLRQLTWLNEFLHSKYKLVYSAGPSRTRPVETYLLKSIL